MKKTVTILLVFFSLHAHIAQENFKYNHILITNDDGIEDADRLLSLARSVKQVAKRVSIIVSSFDRSGTSNHTTFGKHQSTLEVTCKYIDREHNIAAYTIPGNPADCVLIGLNGLFKDDKPDLVLSGINGGANIGPGWFGSGTIGAIRASALLGVPGIALSGFNSDDKRSFDAIPNWVTKFISSELVEFVSKNSYITIGFPDVNLNEIKGVKVVDRRVSFDRPESIVFYKLVGDKPHEPDNKSVWTVTYEPNLNDASKMFDDVYLKEGYIIITPMTIDENNKGLKNTFTKNAHLIPKFSLH